MLSSACSESSSFPTCRLRCDRCGAPCGIRASSGNRRTVQTATKFFSVDPDRLTARDEALFFGALRTGNATFKRTDQARLRTIEQGLPLVRAANTGISAIIDSYGRIETSLDLGLEGVLEGQLPKALPPTLYARAGDWSLLALMLLLGMIGFAARCAIRSR